MRGRRSTHAFDAPSLARLLRHRCSRMRPLTRSRVPRIEMLEDRWLLAQATASNEGIWNHVTTRSGFVDGTVDEQSLMVEQTGNQRVAQLFHQYVEQRTFLPLCDPNQPTIGFGETIQNRVDLHHTFTLEGPLSGIAVVADVDTSPIGSTEPFSTFDVSAQIQPDGGQPVTVDFDRDQDSTTPPEGRNFALFKQLDGSLLLSGTTTVDITIATSDDQITSLQETARASSGCDPPSTLTEDVSLSGSSQLVVTDLFTTLLTADVAPPSIGKNHDVFVSTQSSASVGGVDFSNEDIILYDSDSQSWFMHFDGSDVGLSQANVNAFSISNADNDILLVTDTNTTLPGAGLIESRDVIRFDPTSLGIDTAGDFSLYFDGSDVGVPSGVGIDAFDSLANGNLILSFTDPLQLPGGVSSEPSDIVEFQPESLGIDTAGTWSLYFDGSDVGLSATEPDDSLDIGAISVEQDQLYINLKTSFATPTITGDEADVIRCIPDSLGENTTCNFEVAVDLSVIGLESPADGIAINDNAVAARGASLDVVSIDGVPDLAVVGRGDLGGDLLVMQSEEMGDVKVVVSVDELIDGKFDGVQDFVISRVFNVPTLEANANSLGGEFLGFFLNGEGGNDTLDSTGLQNLENTKLTGGEGNDTLIGGTKSRDEYEGGNGDDTVQDADLLDIGGTISGGEGKDSLSFTGPNGVNYRNLDFETIMGSELDDVIDSSPFGGPVTIDGGDGNDTLTGTSLGDMLKGGQGDDSLSGLDGNDLIIGDKGDDLLDGGAGRDVLTDTEGRNVILGADDIDTIKLVFDPAEMPNSGQGRLTGLDNGSTFNGGPGRDVFEISGTAGPQDEAAVRQQLIDSAGTRTDFDSTVDELVFLGSKITVIKGTVPEGNPEDFHFTGLGGPDGFFLDDDPNDVATADPNDRILPKQRTFFVPPGEYSVFEIEPLGWDVTDIECDDDNSNGLVSGQIAIINLEPNEHVTCTFTNTRMSSINIVKNSIPDHERDFRFRGLGEDGEFVLDDDPASPAVPNTIGFDLAPGTYTVSELEQVGWDLTNIDCDDQNSTVDLGSRTATINLEPLEEVTCTFTNTRQNRDPIAVDDMVLQIIGDGPVSSIDIPVLQNDDDPDGDLLTIADFTQPSRGLTSPSIDFDKITYTPDPLLVGATSFTYQISDGRDGSDEAVVTVVVVPKNSLPVITAIPINALNNPAATSSHGVNQDSEPVYLHNGEFFIDRVDLAIPGRGLNYEHWLKYRSGQIFKGPMGHNWDHSYNQRLLIAVPENVSLLQLNFPDAQVGDVARMDGDRVDLYRRNQDGSYDSPSGFYTRLVQNAGGSFTERNSAGTTVHYRAPDRNSLAAISSMADRDGNTLQFQYNEQQQLVRVIDALGRPIDYSYNGRGLLVELRDFLGRSVKYQYDANDDLVSITSPSVTGTPNGNDFPEGKTVRYSYSSGFDDERLNHNLLTITAPNEVAVGGPPRITLNYVTDTSSPDVDRVLSQVWGGTNATNVPAGGTVTYQYETLTNAPGDDDFSTPVSKTSVVDRSGNLAEYLFNQLGNIVSIREFTNRDVRPSEVEFYETLFEYNHHGRQTRLIYPEGNMTIAEYNDANPNRIQQENVLRTVFVADDDRGGDQQQIESTMAYEPIYNRLSSIAGPRGNDPNFVPQNGGPNSPQRYQTVFTFDYQEGNDLNGLAAVLGVTASEVQQRLADAGVPMGLGDVNGDGRTDQIVGNIIRIDHPSVNLLPNARHVGIEGDTTQQVVQLFAHNDFGQVVRTVDAEGNVTLLEYYPENDPDGNGTIDNPDGDPVTGGYLRQVISDAESHPERNSTENPPPAQVRTTYQYDPVGNVTRVVDGRGIATDYVVNQLNQVVQVTRGAEHDLLALEPPEPMPLVDFQYVTQTAYDFNDNIVQNRVEDRGNTSDVFSAPLSLDDPRLEAGDSNRDGMFDQFDILAVLQCGTYLVQEGVDFGCGDWNGDGAFNQFDILSALRTGNYQQGLYINSGFVDFQFSYDILDDVLEVREEVSADEELVTRYRYDANQNQSLTILPEGNASSAVFDERDLLFQSTYGATTAPPNVLLAPDDPTDYDVRGGIECVCQTLHYDGNLNLIESVDAVDSDRSPDNNSDREGPGDRTRYVYDGFDRLTSIVDSVGNQSVRQYDPASNLVRSLSFGHPAGQSPTSDGPDMLPRPVSSGGIIQQANLVNTNLLAAMESSFDELNRAYQTDALLFVNSGGTMRPVDVLDGAVEVGKDNLTPFDNQPIPGFDGIQIVGRVSQRIEYDRNSRPTFTVEDDGDVFRVSYDGVGRVIRTVDPEGNSTDTAFDDNSNVIEVRETDVSQAPGVADEVFLTTYFYDSLNRLQQTVNNIGHSMSYRYDSRDNLVAMADSQGPMTGASVTRRVFENGPLTDNRINDFGNVTRYFYDGLSRPVMTESILTASGSGDGIHVGASLQGVKDDRRSTESTVPTPDLNQGGGDGIVRRGQTYDQNSLSSAMLDDQGNITLYLYDNLNRPVLQSAGLTVDSVFDKATLLGPRDIVTPTIDTLNNPAFIAESKINEQLALSKARIDAIDTLFGSLAQQTDAPTSVVRGFSPESLVLLLEDENDNEIFWQYDALNRRTEARIFRHGQNDSHADDARFAPVPTVDRSNVTAAGDVVVGTNAQDWQYDGLSRLTRATDNNVPNDANDDSAITYAYDSLSRVIEETQQIGSSTPKAVSTAWRAENLRSSLTYPNGRVIVSTFDRLDRVDTITDVGASEAIVDYQYIGPQRVLERNHPINGTRLTMLNNAGVVDSGYDGLRRPAQLRHVRNDNSLIVGFDHRFDRMNNRVSEGKLHNPTDSETYQYDSLYRLTQFQRGTLNSANDAIEVPSPRVPLDNQWQLDGAGNWRQVDGESRQHSNFNEIALRDEGSQTSPQHDADGNLTDDGTSRFQWDYADRLRRVSDKSAGTEIASYLYDALGRRVRKVVGTNVATDFYYDGWRVIEERNAQDAVVQQYVHGNSIDEALVMDHDMDGDGRTIGQLDERLFYHQNTLGSTFALTDASAATVEGYLYDAYGRSTVFARGENGQVDFGSDDLVTSGGVSAVNNPYLFTGRRLDPESSLYHFRTRYLDPKIGRFIARDNIGTWSDSNNLGNAYAYNGNNPVNRVDPLGTNSEEPGFFTREALERRLSTAPKWLLTLGAYELAIFDVWTETAGGIGRFLLEENFLAQYIRMVQDYRAGKDPEEISRELLAKHFGMLRDMAAESAGVYDFAKAAKAEGFGEMVFYIWTGSSKAFLTIVSLGSYARAQSAFTTTARASSASRAEGWAERLSTMRKTVRETDLVRRTLDDINAGRITELSQVPDEFLALFARSEQFGETLSAFKGGTGPKFVAYNPGDRLFVTALRTGTDPSAFTVFGHGSPAGIAYQGIEHGAHAWGKGIIPNLRGYCGQETILGSCNTAELAEGFHFQLAQITQKPVTGATRKIFGDVKDTVRNGRVPVWYHEEGGAFVVAFPVKR